LKRHVDARLHEDAGRLKNKSSVGTATGFPSGRFQHLGALRRGSANFEPQAAWRTVISPARDGPTHLICVVGPKIVIEPGDPEAVRTGQQSPDQVELRPRPTFFDPPFRVLEGPEYVMDVNQNTGAKPWENLESEEIYVTPYLGNVTGVNEKNVTFIELVQEKVCPDLLSRRRDDLNLLLVSIMQ
jgi:hypothetical protein